MLCTSLTMPTASIDEAPWRHPFLTSANIRRFRTYSRAVWDVALAHQRDDPTPLSCAFVVNMAQNMHKWARLAQKYGAKATLFPSPMDSTALNAPEWEEFDGEAIDPLDGAAFRREHAGITLDVPCRITPLDGSAFLTAYQEFSAGQRRPLLQFLANSPGLRHEPLVAYSGFYPYVQWARELSAYDVLYAASTPFAAYASGRPYCVFSVGGDLMFDCGRRDDYGRAMVLSFNGARFLMASNPHTLAHCRRLGLTNAVHLPYPMDDERYCPAPGRVREEWEARYGRGVYVLTAARLDAQVKGYDAEFLASLVEAARRKANLRFVFLAWGPHVSDVRARLASGGVEHQFIILPIAGKRRLIDYYRSADIVLDQLVYGYYGATFLEAASIGQPIVMHLRTDHYDPLYAGDVAPVVNVRSGAEVGPAVSELAKNRERRIEVGRALREWILRTHGERRTVPLMLALLRLARDRVVLPRELVNPLVDAETEEERTYHEGCLPKVDVDEARRFFVASAQDHRVSLSATLEQDLAHVLRPYGVATAQGRDAPAAWIGLISDLAAAQSLGVRVALEPPGTTYYERRRSRLMGPTIVFRALLPHLSFGGKDVAPIWFNASGGAAIAWQGQAAARRVLVGLDVLSEIIRYRQGDPSRVATATDKAGFGFGWERANYLFDNHVASPLSTMPWVDRLGFALARAWSRLSGYPLLEPLPGGARAAVAITGDDDQAYLEKYAEQLRLVGDTPITYFLHPRTRHSRDTLARFGAHVELGVHPDSLDKPEDYATACEEQTRWADALCGRKIRVVRNHGYLNRGYLGHLPVWEGNGLKLDVNYSAVDGTALTASFLPMRCRRADGTWSDHLSLLTAFGDGMVFALAMPEREAVRRIRRLAHQIESDDPGVLVFNLHPQNIDRTRRLHAEVLRLARRPGWIALGLESYLRWIETLDGITMERQAGTLVLRSARQVVDLVLTWPQRRGWRRQVLPPWDGEIRLAVDGAGKASG